MGGGLWGGAHEGFAPYTHITNEETELKFGSGQEEPPKELMEALELF